MKKILLLTSLTLFLTGCASYENPKLSSNPIDLTHSKEQAEKLWTLSTAKEPKYPAQASKNKISGCARFKISINKDGKTIAPEFISSYPEHAFRAASKKAIDNWTWTPTTLNNDRQEIVRVVQMDFYMPDAKNYEQAKKQCAVDTQF